MFSSTGSNHSAYPWNYYIEKGSNKSDVGIFLVNLNPEKLGVKGSISIANRDDAARRFLPCFSIGLSIPSSATCCWGQFKCGPRVQECSALTSIQRHCGTCSCSTYFESLPKFVMSTDNVHQFVACVLHVHVATAVACSTCNP